VPGSTTSLEELRANVALHTPSWSVVGPIAETVPPLDWRGQNGSSGPLIGGGFTREVYRILSAEGKVVLADGGTTALNGRYLSEALGL